MSRKIELIKEIVIFILIVSLVCMTVVYMTSFQTDAGSYFSADMAQAVRERSYRSGFADLFDGGYVTPYFCGVSVGDTCRGMLARDAASFIHDFSSVWMLFVSSEAQKERVTQSEYYSAFDGDYIYMRFICDVPRSVLAAMFDPELIVSDIGSDAVREMIMALPEGDLFSSDECTLFIRDSAGKCTSYSTDVGTVVSKKNLATYTDNVGGFYYDFAYEQGIAMKSDGIAATVVIPNTTVSLRSVVSSDAFAFGDSYTAEVASVLGINSEKTTPHIADDGTFIYYEEGRSLMVAPDGHTMFDAYSPSGGISLTDLIGFSSSSGYSIIDGVGAALVLLDKLPDVPGAQMMLSGAQSDGRNMVISFDYAYEGMPVTLGKGHALTVSISESMITRVEYTPVYFVSSAKAVAPSILWYVRAEISEGRGLTDVRYAIDPATGGITVVGARQNGGDGR